MFQTTKSQFVPPSLGRQKHRPNPHGQQSAWRRWLPVAAILAVAAISQARTTQPAFEQQVELLAPSTTLPPHLRTIAIAVTRNERPPLEPNDLVDVYSVDVFTGSPILVVDAGRVVDIDDTRIVIAVLATAVADVAARTASRLFTVVGH